MALARLDTIRLTLRAWTLGDVDHVFGAYLDVDLARFISDGRPCSSRSDQEAAIVRIISNHAEWDHRLGVWALEEKASRRPVGAGLLKPMHGGKQLEVGWVLAQSHRGMGLATEAGAALLEHGFGQPGLTRIIALVGVGNAPSRAVCSRLGMRTHGPTTEFYSRELELFSIAACGVA